jgi:aryl-alcohol dehydrogenase-like predicted oxidoreductase
VHVWDPLTPVDELMRVLDDQVRAGKVLHVGISDTPAWVVARANTLADLRGWSPFAGIQVEYSLIERAVERELVPMAHSLDLAVLGWAPLGRGLLTGKYTKEGPSGGQHARLAADDPGLNDRNLAIVDVVKEVAGDLGAQPAAVAIAWLLARSGPVVIPIVGARTAEQLLETLGGVDLELPAEVLSRLSEVSGIELGFPHDFLARLFARYAAVAGAIKTVPSTRGREIGSVN